MNEQLFHYIWLFTQFDVKSLSTSHNLPLSIYSICKSNCDVGSDFLSSRICNNELDIQHTVHISIITNPKKLL